MMNLVMGLPHCQRVIINDFARSNPYPSCSAINIPRNENELEGVFYHENINHWRCRPDWIGFI